MQESRYLAAVAHWATSGTLSPVTARTTRSYNAQRIVALVEALVALMDPPPRLLVLPVLPLTGGAGAERGVTLEATAIEIPGPELAPLVDACRRYDLYLAASAVEKRAEFPGHYFHTGFLLGREGVLLRSPKAQASTAKGVTVLRDIYDAYLARCGEGSVLPVVQTPLGRIGCLVESEIHVPEAVRVLSSKGAEIVVHPSFEPASQPAPWQALDRAAAYQHGIYLLSATTGRAILDLPDARREEWHGGASTIIGPEGAIIGALSGQAQGLVAAPVDLAHLAEVRARQQRFTTPASILYRSLYAQTDP